jgi:hypothetical protein
MELYSSWADAKQAPAPPGAQAAGQQRQALAEQRGRTRSSLLDLSDSSGGGGSPAGEPADMLDAGAAAGAPGPDAAAAAAAGSLEAAVAAARELPWRRGGPGGPAAGALMRAVEAARAHEARERHLIEVVSLFEEMNQTLEDYRNQVGAAAGGAAGGGSPTCNGAGASMACARRAGG